MKGVIVCPQVEAVEIGRRIFEEGGNAIDAAVATAFAQGIAEPHQTSICLLYTSPSPRDGLLSRMPSSA